jgi:transposase InsO family protein
MSKAGYPYDNSAMESFFASLKKEFFIGESMLQLMMWNETCSTTSRSFTTESGYTAAWGT